jgi:ribosomal 30S subunit maturation factor RimM
MDKLEEVNVFTGCKIYMRFEDIKDAIVEQDKSDEWKGYTLINVNDNTTFQIHETRAYPMQTMLVVYNNGDEILIPLVSNWIEATNHDKKVLEMKLPEGLY